MNYTFKFKIIAGELPITVELLNSSKEAFIVYGYGEYMFENVPEGLYTLHITDANNCVYERSVHIDGFTTTEIYIPNSAIIFGNTNDRLTIFDENVTNRNSVYSGFPDLNIVDLYFWFKTKDKKPLNEIQTFHFDIRSYDISMINNQLTFISINDEINMELTNKVQNINKISGDIILKENFIEGFIWYNFNKTSSPDSRFQIDANTTNLFFDTSIPTRISAGTTYGIETITSTSILMNFE